MAGSDEAAVSGDIFIQSQEDEGDCGTLDEPVSATLVSCVLHKLSIQFLSHVISGS